MLNSKNGVFRIYALVLAAIMLISNIPFGVQVAYAEEDPQAQVTQTTSSETTQDPVSTQDPVTSGTSQEEGNQNQETSAVSEPEVQTPTDQEEESQLTALQPMFSTVQSTTVQGSSLKKTEGVLQFAANSSELISMAGTSEDSMIRLTGAARTITGDHAGIQLVGNSNSQKGGAFVTLPLSFTTDATGKASDSDLGFSVAFKVYLGPCSSPPADGFVFVLCKDNTSLGQAGGGIGYSGIDNSIGLEFDTYNNGGVAVPHANIFENGNANFSQGTALNKIFTSKSNFYVYCWANYQYLPASPTDSVLTITYSTQGDPTKLTDSNSKSFTYNIDVPTVIDSTTCHIGFTAATGGCRQQTVISSIYFNDSYEAGTYIDMSSEKNADGSSKYQSSSKKITYVNAGNFSGPTGYIAGTSDFTIGQPTKEGYYFMGWTIGTSGSKYYKTIDVKNDLKDVEGDVILYANWSETPGVMATSSNLATNTLLASPTDPSSGFKFDFYATSSVNNGTTVPSNVNYVIEVAKVKDASGKAVTTPSNYFSSNDWTDNTSNTSKKVNNKSNTITKDNLSSIEGLKEGYIYTFTVKTEEDCLSADEYTITLDLTDGSNPTYTIFNANTYKERTITTQNGFPVLDFHLGHTHEWAYATNTNGEILAYCTASGSDIDPCKYYSDGKDLDNAQVVTLSRPSGCNSKGCIEAGTTVEPVITLKKDPYGQAETVTLADLKLEGVGDCSGTDINIKYYKASGTNADGSTNWVSEGSQPQSVGKYKAELTIGGASTSVTYEITKAVPTTSTPSPTDIIYDGAAHDLLNEKMQVVTGNGQNDNKIVYWVNPGTEYIDPEDVPDASWTDTIPQATNAGYYAVYYKVLGNDADSWDYQSSIGCTTAIIEKRTIKITASTGRKDWDGKEADESEIKYTVSCNWLSGTWTPADIKNGTGSATDLSSGLASACSLVTTGTNATPTSTPLDLSTFYSRIYIEKEAGTEPGVYQITTSYAGNYQENASDTDYDDVDSNYAIECEVASYTIDPKITTVSNGVTSAGTWIEYGKQATTGASGTNADVVDPSNNPENLPVFAGWYLDAKCTQRWNSDEYVCKNRNLYAKWVDETHELDVEVQGVAVAGSTVTIKQKGEKDANGNDTYVIIGTYPVEQDPTTGKYVAKIPNLPENDYIVQVSNGNRESELVSQSLTADQLFSTDTDVPSKALVIQLPKSTMKISVTVYGNVQDAQAVGLTALETKYAPLDGEKAKIVLNVTKVNNNDSVYATEIAALKSYAKSSHMDFVNMDINHWVNDIQYPNIVDTGDNLITVTLGAFSNGTIKGIYRYHVTDSGKIEISSLKQLSADTTTMSEGTFRVKDGKIIICATKFSVYGIDYDPNVSNDYYVSGVMVNTDLSSPVTNVTVNGKKLDTSKYELYGTSVLFKQSYIDSLKPGTYTVRLTDGKRTYTSTLTITKDGRAFSAPKTTDPGVGGYMVMSITSLCGMGLFQTGFTITRKRKREGRGQ